MEYMRALRLIGEPNLDQDLEPDQLQTELGRGLIRIKVGV